jgi:hypothetical protein
MDGHARCINACSYCEHLPCSFQYHSIQVPAHNPSSGECDPCQPRNERSSARFSRSMLSLARRHSAHFSDSNSASETKCWSISTVKDWTIASDSPCSPSLRLIQDRLARCTAILRRTSTMPGGDACCITWKGAALGLRPMRAGGVVTMPVAVASHRTASSPSDGFLIAFPLLWRYPPRAGCMRNKAGTQD